MTTLLITQRSFLIGLPLALIALTKIWETTESNRNQQAEDTNGGNRAMFMTGLLTGMLPLVHVHTLAALFVVCAVLMLSCTRIQIRRLVSFGLGVAVVGDRRFQSAVLLDEEHWNSDSARGRRRHDGPAKEGH
jgi:hypothetical protein